MADFSIDYSQLQIVQTKMRSLADEAGSGGADGKFKEVGEGSLGDAQNVLGNRQLAAAFQTFYTRSRSRTKQAKDGLTELADTFKGVSDAWFDADSKLAGSGGTDSQRGEFNEWVNDKKAHDKWLDDKAAWDGMLEDIGATEYFEENPDASIRQVCAADDAPDFCAAWRDLEKDGNHALKPGDEPPLPEGDGPPTEYTYEDEDGTVKVTLEYDDDYNVTKQTSEISNPHGQSYKSEQVFDGPVRESTGSDGGSIQDYTLTTTYGDGTESVAVVKFNDDGSGTMEVTADGETTKYTHTGKKDDEWEEVED
ncbi:serine/arginine repetitive matrix protein 2 [Streptomyces xiamenensis]|uniref:serine/arginine repetitive matrix protein 2 n=1 Tax=Streptomyces TaxID=1883 RepID=UPI00190855C2|nr:MULTISPECIES: serine/arginine repetitive matrix protein 2 [unclassified Streptomyces]MCU4747968.1 serine/arginine repetitive matrix protein 2 [Streptomyces sp. G-5]QQN78580.1 serine/arginine repetitive matrix protein 2 [Streptomyces sp. XC 2026]